MEKLVKFQSPSKINLTLDVLGKAENGYHLLRSVIMPNWGLVDNIVCSRGAAGIKIVVKGSGVRALRDEKKNMVWGAAQAFFSATGIAPAVKIELHKRIPIASGLGGGSSNAGTTLLALNQLYGAPLSKKQLHVLAAQLGMDVPFFLNPQLSLATHFGEKITPIKRLTKKLPSVTLLSSKTKKLSTKIQYERLDLSLCGTQKTSTIKLLKLLKTSQKTWDPAWNTLLHNDFDQLFKKPSKKPDTKLPPSTPQNTHLSGSGPTRFTIRPTV